ncbi:MAG: cobalt-precorrin 5A hydrolase [Dehalococcoidia bacterium]
MEADTAGGKRHGFAVVAVTRRGSQLALRLAEAFGSRGCYLIPCPLSNDAGEGVDEDGDGAPEPATAYVPERFLDFASSQQLRCDRIVGYSGSVAAVIQTLFPASKGLILVLATGAAVRLIAPLLEDKRRDPAVVTVDDAGRFAISLISGHRGGANRLAGAVAEAIGALPVITTASEAAGIPALDLLGRDLGWKVESNTALKTVAAALVNGDSVGVYQDAGSDDWQRTSSVANLTRYPSIKRLIEGTPAAAIIVSDRVVDLPLELARRTVIYRPPTLVLGIGCSRGASELEIEKLVQQTLVTNELSPLSVAAVASIDLKAAEPGLCRFAHQHGLPLLTYPAAQLERVAGEWQRSDVVLRAVGVGGVAEPAALLGADTDRLLVEKVKSKHATLAIARRSVSVEERAESRPGPALLGEAANWGLPAVGATEGSALDG